MDGHKSALPVFLPVQNAFAREPQGPGDYKNITILLALHMFLG